MLVNDHAHLSELVCTLFIGKHAETSFNMICVVQEQTDRQLANAAVANGVLSSQEKHVAASAV